MQTLRNFRRTAAILAILAGTGAPVAAETLADALAYGYEDSGLLEQNRALLRAADEDVAQAVAELRPIISYALQAQVTYPDTPFASVEFTSTTDLNTSIGITASLTLYDGGRNQLALEATKQSVLATRQSLLQVEQQVLFRIVQAYMEVIRAKQFVTLAENNLRVLTQELQASQDRFDVGEITRTDVYLTEARVASARADLASAQGNLALSIEEFRAAVGRDPGNLVFPAAASTALDEAAAKSYAIQNHPAIRQAQYNVTVAEIGVERASRSSIPTLSVTGQVGYDENWDNSAAVGLSLTGPIYQGGQLASITRQVIAQRDATRAGLIVTAQSVEQTVGNAFAQLEVARATSTANAQQVEAALVAFQGVQEEATLGARTTLDVLDAEQDLLDARAAQISSQVDVIVASYGILASMGVLTAEDLNLNVQIYDPTAYYNLVDDAPSSLSTQGQALDRVLQSIGGN